MRTFLTLTFCICLSSLFAQKTTVTFDNVISAELPCQPEVSDTTATQINQCATSYAVFQFTRSILDVPKKNELKKEEDLESFYKAFIDGFSNGGQIEILTKDKYWLNKFFGYELSGYIPG